MVAKKSVAPASSSGSLDGGGATGSYGDAVKETLGGGVSTTGAGAISSGGGVTSTCGALACAGAGSGESNIEEGIA